MWLRVAGVLMALLCLQSTLAQLPDDYYPYAEREQRREPLMPDSAIFYRAVQASADLYGREAVFRLPAVDRPRRGFDDPQTTFLEVPLHYRYFAAMRLLGAEEEQESGRHVFAFTKDEPLQPYHVAVNLRDRNYRVGAQGWARIGLKHDWRLSMAVDAATGRDMHIDGVFTHALTVATSLEKSFDNGLFLNFLLVVPPSMRGTRLSSVEEAFRLTDNRFYNPAWGYQSGKVRNSRVRREWVPLAMATCRLPLSKRTEISATLAAECGIRKYSLLDWYDARTPQSDNYHYLPSYTGDRETELAWRENDPRLTQLDWDEMIRQNRMTDGHAVYALADRVERLCNLTANIFFTTEVDDALQLRYGLVCRREHGREYKQMRDLLGADHTVDIDQYLIDDDTYNNMLQNDLHHPDRTIRQGDRFGYDFALDRRYVGGRFEADYRADRLRVNVQAEVTTATAFREGFYEKELFPDKQSFGRSRHLHFSPYRFRALVGWAFSPRSYLSATATAQATLPDAYDLFYQPQYNNRAVETPTCTKRYGFETTFRHTGKHADLQLTAYAMTSFDGMESRRYYDDLASLYCDLAVRHIGLLSYGIEAAANFRLSARWQGSLSASTGRFRYVRDPELTVLSDVDNSAIDVRAVSRMRGCRIGNAPQLTATASLAYFDPKGWGCRLSSGYAGARYVEPVPLRRTDRVTALVGLTREQFDGLIRQQRLPDAFTLDVSAFKSFHFDPLRLTVALTLRNLTDGCSYESGYESMRMRRAASGDFVYYKPQVSRYLYAYPRSFILTISCQF